MILKLLLRMASFEIMVNEQLALQGAIHTDRNIVSPMDLKIMLTSKYDNHVKTVAKL